MTCKLHRLILFVKKLKTFNKVFLRYSDKFAFLFCPITKAGSSTWIQQMIKLSGETRVGFASKLDSSGIPVKIRKNMRKEHFPLPEDQQDLQQVSDTGISFR